MVPIRVKENFNLMISKFWLILANYQPQIGPKWNYFHPKSNYSKFYAQKTLKNFRSNNNYDEFETNVKCEPLYLACFLPFSSQLHCNILWGINHNLCILLLVITIECTNAIKIKRWDCSLCYKMTSITMAVACFTLELYICIPLYLLGIDEIFPKRYCMTL